MTLEKYNHLEQVTQESYFSKIGNSIKKIAQYATFITAVTLAAGCGGGGGSGGVSVSPPIPVDYRQEAITKRMSFDTIAFTSEKVDDYSALHSESRVLCDVVNAYGAQSIADKFAEILARGSVIGQGIVDKPTWLTLLDDWNDNDPSNSELNGTILDGYGVVFDKINYQVGINLDSPLGFPVLHRIQLTQTDFDDLLNDVIYPALNKTYELNEGTLGTTNYDPNTGEQVAQITFDI